MEVLPSSSPFRLRTYDQAAEDLAVSRRTVERLASVGLLTKVHVGRRAVRFRSDQIRDFVDVYTGDVGR